MIYSNWLRYILWEISSHHTSHLRKRPFSSNNTEISSTLAAYLIHNKVEIMDSRDPQRHFGILSMSRVN